jgi:hypothetical protein
VNKPLGILIVVLITLSSLLGCTSAEFEVSTSREEPNPAQTSEPASAPNTTPDVVQEKVEDMGGSFTEDLMVIRSQAEMLGIEVQLIAHAGDSITLTCQADSYNSFKDYLTNLEESGRFTTPIPYPERFPFVKGGSITLKPKFQMDISEVYYIGNQALTPMTDSAAIAMLVSIAEKSGIDITPEPGKFRIPAATFNTVEVGGNTYKVMSFKNIWVQGNYDNIIAFISDLDSGATMETMVLTLVTISEVDGKIEIRATVDVDIYTKSY